jgi:hypothetical protein
MIEYLVFEVWVPIDTPDINHNTKPYLDTLDARLDAAEKVMETSLPHDWTFTFAGKMPQ